MRIRNQDGARRMSFLALLVCAAVTTAAGCSFETSIYYPGQMAPSQPAIGSIAVRTVSNRAPNHGGQTSCIGRVRGGYGNPFPIYERDASNIEKTVADATSDALLEAGVSTDTSSKRVLVATLNEYWIDGYGAFNATVKVDYALQDANGQAVWQRSVAASGGDVMRNFVFEAATIAQTAFEHALRGVAVQMKTEFQGEDFQRLVRAAPGR